MRIFSAGIDCETNTFSPIPTTLRTFEDVGLWRGNAGAGNSWLAPVAATWARRAAECGAEYVEGLYAAAQPAGPVLASLYDMLRAEILEDIESRGPFDIVLLHLHGAMVAEGCDDCEGDMLARVRSLLPHGGVLGALLDPHCHLTEAMVQQADLLIACKHFPHEDYAERADELFTLCVRTLRGEVRPVAATFDCRMIGLYPTHEEPMASVVRALVAAEHSPGILSASFIHGFAYGDTADTGAKMLVYGDDDRERAQASAIELGHMIYRLRHRLQPRYLGVEAALDEIGRVDGTVVLADTADNAGGGAPGDNVSVLSALLQRGIGNVALGSIWDPQIVMLCAEVGIGARVHIRLGGKAGPASGLPLDVTATVRAIEPNHSQASLGDTRQPMASCAWIEVQGVDVVVSSVRSQVFAPDLFTGLGIDLAAKKAVVVKSTNHFVSRFAPIATRIIHMATPGALTVDFANIDYRKRTRDYYPRSADPLSLD
jgi:microcystin degradation protein MlrC